MYEITEGPSELKAWSVTRLPFEPSGWLRTFRTDLQTALRGMRLPPGCGLLAQYASPDAGFADLENVLLSLAAIRDAVAALDLARIVAAASPRRGNARRR